jgi:putative ATP-dependent endonuclease of OLD family
LSFKGDGIQSIAALSLRRAEARSRAGNRSTLLLIEEPEAHLHPGAARKLRLILEDISKTVQIGMTTHNPVFVDRSRPSNNVIVEGNRARVATTIEEIRVQLGVIASDNLLHADLVLLVEGETDAKALSKILSDSSTIVGEALNAGRLAIAGAGGCDRIPYQANLIKGELCEVQAFLDFDSPGRGAAKAALDRGLLEVREVSYASCRGTREAEIEDLYSVEAYQTEFLAEFGVTLPSKTFNRNRGKWSSRMSAAFLDQGHDWEASSLRAKLLLSEIAARRGEAVLDASMRGPVDALVATLESRLSRT